jgi:pimeloyl-ACP methyl ester carboxylesterase
VFFRRYTQPSHEGRPPLVLIHGAGGNLAFWPPEVRRLPQAQVYALDLPGHGESAGPSLASIDDYAAAVLAQMRAEQLAPALVVGHSMGGAVALAVARQAPERVQAMALIATGARLPVSPQLLGGLAEDFDATVGRLVDWSMGPTVNTAARKEYGRHLMRVPQQVLINDFSACAAFDMRAQLGALIMPALVLCGAQDRMTRPAISLEMADGLPQTTLRLLEQTGHMIPLERPHALATMLSNFHNTLNTREGNEGP